MSTAAEIVLRLHSENRRVKAFALWKHQCATLGLSAPSYATVRRFLHILRSASKSGRVA